MISYFYPLAILPKLYGHLCCQSCNFELIIVRLNSNGRGFKMNSKNVDYFIDTFYASHQIPVAVFKGGELSKILVSNDIFSNYWTKTFQLIKDKSKSPRIIAHNEIGLVGYIQCTNDASLLIGPVLFSSVSDKMVQSFLYEAAVQGTKHKEAEDLLSSLPHESYNHFVNLILLINFSLNNKKVDVGEFYNLNSDRLSHDIEVKKVDIDYDNKQVRYYHGTYNLENKILDLVKNGEIAILKDFLLSVNKTESLHEGKVANTALRQAKNIALGLLVQVGKNAAIPGGMDIEDTYQLIDIYSQEIENCSTIDEVTSLQFNMILDFARRVSQAKVPSNIDPILYKAIEYIKRNVNAPINVFNLVKEIGYSKSWLENKFRTVLNTSIKNYIMKARLEEAKRLLKYSDKSLCEISDFLLFSSQSYFQNSFKKMYGVTPKTYRLANGTRNTRHT